MKRNILTPIAAIAALTFSLSGCSSTEHQHDATAMGTTSATADMQAVTVTEPEAYDTGFERQYEAETRSGGLSISSLSLTNEVKPWKMFNEIDNTRSYTISGLAGTSSNLSTFVELLRATGMLASLEGSSKAYTVFAPTNEAFAALPAGKLEHLLKPENRTELMALLDAHILPTKVKTSQFNSGHRITLADDRIIPIDVDHNAVVGSRATINVGGATIVKPDVETSNGVMHVVDAVITPVDQVLDMYGR